MYYLIRKKDNEKEEKLTLFRYSLASSLVRGEERRGKRRRKKSVSCSAAVVEASDAFFSPVSVTMGYNDDDVIGRKPSNAYITTTVARICIGFAHCQPLLQLQYTPTFLARMGW